MSGLLSVSRFIDTLSERVGRSVSWLVLIVVIISAGNAIIRKIFNWGSNSLLEIQWYLFATIFLLCAAYTLLRNEHVRIDVLASKLSPRKQLFIELLGTLFFLIPMCSLILVTGTPYFWSSLSSMEWSSNPGGLIIWPVKLMIPLGFGLLLAQAISHLIKTLAALSGKVSVEAVIKHHDLEQEAEEAAAAARRNVEAIGIIKE